MLENFLSMLLGGAFFFGLGVLDISILIRRYGEVDSLYEAFQSILRTFGWDFKLDAGYLASICFSLLSGWFATITAAFLADVVSSALLNGKKFNYLVSFVLFLALSYLIGKVGNAVAGDVLTRTEEVVELTMPNAMQSYGTVSTVTTSPGYFLRSGAVSLAFSALFYVCTAEIMQRKLSV
jgi:ABC-type multidrug transport system fused ATPase/permease subunit